MCRQLLVMHNTIFTPGFALENKNKDFRIEDETYRNCIGCCLRMFSKWTTSKGIFISIIESRTCVRR